MAALTRQIWKVVKKASAKNPPRRAKKNAVPMKAVTALAAPDGENPIFVDRYKTRLLAFAKNARFSKTSTTRIYMDIHNKYTIPINTPDKIIQPYDQ